jgi:prepilin-type N-terminal cleavage/methylation domain-containing protein/prepilin-type processing-associated H-X9-DG protein
MRGQSRGFTLVELLVVMGIICILAGLLLPAASSAIGAAQRSACAASLRQIAVGFRLYSSDSDLYYPARQDPVSEDPFYWFWMGRGWRQAVAPYVDRNIEVLYCPADETAPEKWESTSYGYSMAFYHSAAQIDTLSDKADTYSNPLRTIPQRVGRAVHPAGKVMVAEWLSNHRPLDDDAGWWCWEGARNCLFADGHVAYHEATDFEAANDGFPDFNLTAHGLKGRDRN